MASAALPESAKARQGLDRQAAPKTTPASTDHRRALALFAILLSLIVGISVGDRTGAVRNEGLFVASNLYRLGIFMLIGLATTVFLYKRRPSIFPKGSRILYLVYVLAAIATLIASDVSLDPRNLRLYYSILEWTLFIIVACIVFDRRVARNFSETIALLQKFLIYLSSSTVALVSVVAVVMPELAYFPGARLSFGGFLIHPNKLSVVCALGVAAWMSNQKSRMRIQASLLLIAVAAYTGSTSGTALSIFAFSHGLVNLVSKKWRFVPYFVASLAILAMAAMGIGGAVDLVRLAESGDLTNLNGREAVWRATFYMLSQHPYFGWGWLDGPNLIGRFTGQDWWFARNAQNDILNFAVSGGLMLGLLSAILYARIIIVGIASELSKERRLYTSCGAIIFLSSMVEPIASGLANSVGFVWVALVVVGARLSDRPMRIFTSNSR